MNSCSVFIQCLHTKITIFPGFVDIFRQNSGPLLRRVDKSPPRCHHFAKIIPTSLLEKSLFWYVNISKNKSMNPKYAIPYLLTFRKITQNYIIFYLQIKYHGQNYFFSYLFIIFFFKQKKNIFINHIFINHSKSYSNSFVSFSNLISLSLNFFI